MRRFKLGWRTKASAFRLFDALPRGATLYYLAQRYVTRTIPRDLSEHDGWQVEHARVFRRFYTGDLGRARLFEFGAGWDLHSSLVQWCYGINDQTVVDITRLARRDLVNLAIEHLQRHPPAGAVRIPDVRLSEPFERSLRTHYGITYLAPADARRTGLEDGSIDLFCTTSVLEHVPADSVREILRECRRIASGRAVMSHVIDYTDHYAHSDPSIGLYNFLQFADVEWEPFNPAMHYQNRLRHFEYGPIFDAAGFTTVDERRIDSPPSEADLRGLQPAERFRSMTPEQLTVRTGHWVLARR
jgi:hypothetical protein